MKKIMVVLLLLVLIFGCATVSEQESLKETVDKTAKEPSIKVEETAEAESVKETEKETTPTKGISTTKKEFPDKEETITPDVKEADMTKELTTLLNKIDDKVLSFKYTYGEPPHITESNTYWVQLKNQYEEEDFLIRVDLYEYEPTRLEDYWDTVFLNPAKKEAVIYCLDRTLCQSKQLDKTKEKNTVDYDAYMTKTPYEWAKEIPKNAKVVGPELVEGRTVTRFEYTGTDGAQYDVWIDNTYGMPLRIVVITTEGEELEYLFRDLAYNIAKDEDFKAPF